MSEGSSLAFLSLAALAGTALSCMGDLNEKKQTPGLYINLLNPLAQSDMDLEKCTYPDLKCTSPDLKYVNFKLFTYCTLYALTCHTKS